jgi:hypothetical protein
MTPIFGNTIHKMGILVTPKQQAVEDRSISYKECENILDRARVYLSGPMDFVASRIEEKKNGWRTRISTFLQRYGATVYDPWNKPQVSGMRHYGKEDEFTLERREDWTYGQTADDAGARAELCELFWPTLHIDLRMTDLADFIIAYCPTNIYSVGTVHEIATARLEHKPVLLVTPPIDLSVFDELEKYLASLSDGGNGSDLLKKLATVVPTRGNMEAIPSLWYMAMLQYEDYFFDGFGFAEFKEEFGWEDYPPLDERERRFPPHRPLLPYLKRLNKTIPKRYDAEKRKYVENPDWLIFVEENLAQRDAATR